MSRLTSSGSIVALSFQQHASSAPFSLNSLRFVNSAFALRYDWNLPFFYLLPLFTFVGFSLVPPALWSGSLTPDVVAKNVTVPFKIPSVQHVNHTENPFFKRSDAGDGICVWLNRAAAGQGEAPPTFHNCLNRLALLQSAASSSSLSYIPGGHGEAVQYHTKLDRSGYSFIGRSYGVGGTIGLYDLDGVKDPLSHLFKETGLQTNVECIYNSTAKFRLNQTDNHAGFRYWQDVGNNTMPEGLNANRGGNGVHLVRLDIDAFSWGTAYNPDTRTAWFALAAVENPRECSKNTQRGEKCGYGFLDLHKAQCRLQFEAREFNLLVDDLLRTITVVPGPVLDWPSYADDMLDEIAAEHNNIAGTDGSLGGSQIGHAIRSNVGVLRQTRNETAFNEQTTLDGIQSFISDLMDNTLMSFAQSQHFGHNASREADAEVTRNVVVYGKASFVYATVCINLLIVAICILEAVRTRFWKHICKLDLLDMASVAVGASYGGSKLAAQMQSLDQTRFLLPGPRASVQEITGSVKVRLRDINDSMCAIEPAIIWTEEDRGEDIPFSIASSQSDLISSKGGNTYSYRL